MWYQDPAARSQDIGCKSVDVVHPFLLGNLYTVFQRCKDIQFDSGNRSLLTEILKYTD